MAYFVKQDFKFETAGELNKIERQVEEDLLIELRQNCFREKSYSLFYFIFLFFFEKNKANSLNLGKIEETAIWRARTYGDERLLRKATEYETPSCDRISHIFGGG